MAVIQQSGATRTLIARDLRTVVTAPQRAASKVQRDTHVASVSSPGVQGPAGLNGVAGALSYLRIADATLGGHRLVRATGTDSVNYVDNQLDHHGDDTLGVTTGAADAGTGIVVQAAGEMVEASWSWSPGLPIFAGINGQLTQTAPDPAAGAAFDQQVAIATSPTSLIVAIEPAIYF